MSSHLYRWQAITLVTLWVGYAGYYICRSDLSVAGPLLEAELAQQPPSAIEERLEEVRAGIGDRITATFYWVTGLGGTTRAVALDAVPTEKKPAKPAGQGKRRIGMIASLGLMAYVIGKFTSGIACDFLGGRRMFLFGMVASVACTVAFGLATGFAAFLAIWSANRLVQSVGWNGLVKLSSRWFPTERHGTILGLLTLSYLFGDAIARLCLGGLLMTGLGWRGMFFVAAAVLAAIALVARFTLKASPADVGAPEPEANPENVYGPRGNAPRPTDLVDLLLPLATSFSFWLVCLVSFGLTLVRESFNLWNPIYLKEVAGLPDGRAALASAIFPFVGGVSTLAAGLLTDRLAGGRRGTVMLPYLVVLVAALVGLSRVEPGGGFVLPLVLTSIVSFALLGPYSFLTGVMSLDFGGKRGSSTAAGLADTAGYLGGIVSGYGVGAIAEDRGWPAAFTTLAGVAVATLFAGTLYWYLHDVRRPRRLSRAA
ncbi:MAG: MFS transporter [Planctomycetia bacterium]|nr:MFS transporter [Planctomycetia bacterium]